MSRNATLDRQARRERDAPTSVDPRIAARRDEVERARSRRLRRRLVVVLGVLAVLVGAVGLTRTPLLDVDRIEVRGNHAVTSQAIQVASALRSGDRMTGVDPGKVAARVEALPWIRTASVERRWPGAVRITVVERHPVAVITGPSGPEVVDAGGRVLGPASGRDSALARLTGRASAGAGERLGAPWRATLEVAQRLPDELRSSIASIGTGRTGPVIRLTTGTVVVLCDGSHLDAKLGALLALVQRADPTTAARIDLCVPGAPALTRKGRGA